jgi:hypothetical protein
MIFSCSINVKDFLFMPQTLIVDGLTNLSPDGPRCLRKARRVIPGAGAMTPSEEPASLLPQQLSNCLLKM